MPGDNVPDVKFTDGSNETPGCILWIQGINETSPKTLLAACCKISRCQPVKLLNMLDVYCKDWTLGEVPKIRKSVQSVVVLDCDLPLNFWRNILYQLFDCVDLQHLWLGSSHLHQLEDVLDELLDNLDKRDPTKRKVDVELTDRYFSETFVRKWRRQCSAIECQFPDSFSDSDSSDDEQTHPVGEIYLSKESITADLVNAIVMSEPPSLNQLILRDCLIHDGKAFQKLFSQNFCQCVSVLDLGGTNLRFYVKHINGTITKGMLKELCLRDCRIPPLVCSQIIDALYACKNITHLNLSKNTLNNCRMEFADAILAWGSRPPLLELDLSQCSLPSDVSAGLLSALGICDQLINLRLQGNTLTACLSSFLKDPHEGLHFLEKLFLDSTSLNSEDMSHLAQLIEKGKLPMLRELHLASNALHTMEDVVENLLQTCVTQHLKALKVNVSFNNLSESLEDKCKSLCSGTHIELQCVGYCMELPWTEDEFLEGFYDDEDMEIDDHEERDDNEKNNIDN